MRPNREINQQGHVGPSQGYDEIREVQQRSQALQHDADVLRRLDRYAFSSPYQGGENLHSQSDLQNDAQEYEGRNFTTLDGAPIAYGIKAEYNGDAHLDEVLSSYNTSLAEPQVRGKAHPVETLTVESKFYNCHSYSLTHSRDTWLLPEDHPIEKMLVNPVLHYSCTQTPVEHDLAVYRNGDGEIIHSGRYLGRDQYNQSWVRSKWGAGPLTDHVDEAVPLDFHGRDNFVRCEYWHTNHPNQGYLD